MDAEAYRKRLKGDRVPFRCVKDDHLGDPFPVKDGAIESLPEEAREASRLLGSSASAHDALEPNIWDHDRGDTIPQSEDKEKFEGTVQNGTEKGASGEGRERLLGRSYERAGPVSPETGPVRPGHVL